MLRRVDRISDPRNESKDVVNDELKHLIGSAIADIGAMRSELAELRIVVDSMTNGPMAPETDDYDPLCRFDPAGWKGQSCKGKKMSECGVEFLEAFAVALLSMAAKEDIEKKLYKNGPASRLTRQNAARARRWALRKRLGWEPSEPEPAPPGFGTPSDAPFGGAPVFGGQSGFGTSQPNVEPTAQTRQFDNFGKEDDEDEDSDLPF